MIASVFDNIFVLAQILGRIAYIFGLRKGTLNSLSSSGDYFTDALKYHFQFAIIGLGLSAFCVFIVINL